MNNFGADNTINRLAFVKMELSNLSNGSSLIDVGAGECRYRSLASHLKYRSQDFCEYQGVGNTVGLQTGKWDTSSIDIVSDICDIPVEDNEFDAVLCTEVLEHVPNPIDALREIVRIVKPGGRIIITVPFVSFTHYAPYHFCTGFSQYFFEHYFELYNCTLLKVEKNGTYSDFMAQEFNRMKTFYGNSNWYIKVLTYLLKRYVRRRKNYEEMIDLATNGLHVVAVKN